MPKKDKNKKKKERSAFEQKFDYWAGKLFRVKSTDKIFFVDHLRIMVKAGLSLVDALNILAKEVANKKFKKIISQIRDEVEKGRQLSEVLGEHPKVFPIIYVKMIASGEVAGKLEESLEQIVNQMKKSHELVSSIRGAMIYPAVILTAMSGIGIMMTTFVLPKILELFKDFDAELPLATRTLIAIVDFLSNPVYLVLIIAVAAGSIALFAAMMKRSPKFKKTIHTINLYLPIFGRVVKQINLAKFSLTLSSLLKSTIPIIDAMDITADTCANVNYQESLHSAAVKMKSGEPLSEILREYDKFFPPMVTEMIMVGERSGEVDQMLIELSEFYGREVDKTMKNFSTIIEPVIIILLG
ncbi:MAG: type II secretion system F family protein, partial [Patescibacteria group bacterium]